MTTPLTPPPMTDEQILTIRRSVVADSLYASETRLAQAVIADRDAQWQARVAELERDAARLDFLIAEDNCVVNEGTNGFWLCWLDEHDHTRTVYQKGSFPTARAAIDAARGSKGGV